MKKLNIYFSIFSFIAILIAGCDSSSIEDNESFKFLVLKECEEYVISYLSSIPEDMGLSIEYFPFDFQIPSHSEVVGYIELSSKYEGEEGLETYANAVWLDCYPTATERISRSNTDYPSEVFKSVELGEKFGDKSRYFQVDKDEVIIYFRQNK